MSTSTEDARKGIACPSCGEIASTVLDTRPTGHSQRRRRECLVCQERWNTYEVTEAQYERLKDDRVAQLALEIVRISSR